MPSSKGKRDAVDKAALAREVGRRLKAALGAPTPPPRRPVLDELILTILSQNTNDRNRDRAFNSLKARFSSWEEILGSRRTELEKVIAPAGLAPTKSRRIRTILEKVYRKGIFDPATVCRLPREEARKLLTSLDGVGPKTAACVLLFSCGIPAFPVDTHIHRVCKRLGLIGAEVGREKAHVQLEALFPEEDYLQVHLNIIRLGRTVCRPSSPRCLECALLALCPFGVGSQNANLREARTPARRRKSQNTGADPSL